jgi:PAS domain S-box-containing protein
MKKEEIFSPTKDDFFFTLSQISPSAIIIIKNKRLLFYNHAFQKLIQLPEEKIENTSLPELTHPLYRELLISKLKEKEIKDFKFMLINNKWVSLYTRAHQNNPEIKIAFINDFTEVIKTETELKESEEKYRMIFNSTNDAIIIHEKDTINIIDVNKTARKMFGYSSEALHKLDPRTFFVDQHPYTLKEAIEWHRKAINEGPQLFEWRTKDSSGRQFWVEVNLSLAKIGKDERVIASVRNIDERKSLENALFKSEHNIRDFIEKSTEGIWYIAFEIPIRTNLPPGEQVELMYQHGYVADCNRQFALMYGYDNTEYFIGKRFVELHGSSHNKKNIKATLTFIQNGYRIENTETYEKNRFGNEVIFLNNSVGIIEDGFLIGIWGMQRNITGQKKMEAQISQAQKMDSIGTLAGGIAHDFNNILTIINGHAEMALMKLKENVSVEPDIKTIHNAGKKAADLTKQLLAFSRKQIYSPKLININKTIENLKTMLHRLISEDITLNIFLDENASPIKADTTQIEQILINLIVNSRDAINEKESKTSEKFITITTQTVFLDQAFTSVHAGSKTGYFLLLSIKDSGKGIEQSIINRVFEPFFTTKSMHKGTGLGLSTVYGIVKQNKGYINIESELGQGTTVNIYWPVVQETKEFEQGTENLQLIKSNSETILFIDEDTDVRDFSVNVLQEMGYHVLEADSHKKAFKIINAAKHKIDLIISSIILQDAYKANNTHKILYTTGFPENNSSNRKDKNNTIAYLTKPFSALTLAKKIRSLLEDV